MDLETLLPDHLLVKQIESGGINRRRCTNKLFDTYSYWVPKLSKKYNLPEEEVVSAYVDTITDFCNQVKRGEFMGKASVKTYLYGILKNKCVDQLRKKKTFKNRQIIEDKLSDLPDDENDILRKLIGKEDLNLVKSQFVLLGDFCKKFLVDIFFHDLNTSELIGKYELKNSKHIRNRKFKCMEHFRKLIGKKEKDSFLG